MNLRSSFALALWLSNPALLAAQGVEQVLAEASVLARVEGRRADALALLHRQLEDTTDGAATARLQAALRALGDPAATPQDPPIQKDPLAELIARLDTGPGSSWTNDPTPAHLAFRKLKDLGTLCVPSLYATLDRLGPFGLENALHLLVEFSEVDPLVAALRRMLQSQDLVQRHLAGRFLKELPTEARVALARDVLSADDERLQLDAVRALLGVPGQDGVVVERLRALVASSSSRIVRDACTLLSRGEFSDTAVAKELLSEALGHADPEVVSTALAGWAHLAGPEDGPRALELWRAHGALSGSRALVERAFELQDARWAALVAHNLSFAGRGSRVGNPQAQALELLARWGFVVPAETLRTFLRTASTGTTGTPAKAVLDYLSEVDHPAGAEIGLELLEARGADRGRAFHYLTQHHPARLIAQAERFLRDAEFSFGMLDVLTHSKDERTIRLLVDALRSADCRIFGDLLHVLRYAARPEDVPELLRLVAIPAPTWTISSGVPNASSQWSNHVARATDVIQNLFAANHVPAVLQRAHELPASVAGHLLQRARALVDASHLDAVQRMMAPWLERSPLEAPRLENDSDRTPTPSDLVYHGIQLLHHVGGAGGRQALVRMTSRSEAWIRELAYRALLTLPDIAPAELAAIAVHSDIANIRKQAWEMPASATQPELREVLVGRLVDPEEVVERTQAAQFLANVPADGKAELLIRVLKATRTVPAKKSVHLAAASALADLGEPAYILQIAESLASPDDEVRAHAVTLLGATFDPRAVPFLLVGLRDRETRVRAVAKHSLDKYREYFEAKGWWESWLKDHGGK